MSTSLLFRVARYGANKLATANITNNNNRYKFSAIRMLSSSSSRPTTENSLTEAQVAHWLSYLATGRGTVALFSSIDRDQDHVLQIDDVRAFFDALNKNEHLSEIEIDPLPKSVMKDLQERASDHPVTLQEFQSWLVSATSKDYNGSSMQSQYEKWTYIGDRSSKYRAKRVNKDGTTSPPDENTTAKPLASNRQEPSQHHEYSWNESTMSQSLRRMQYAVRGQVVIKAQQLAEEGRDIIYTNIGNPQAVGQKPITYYRQVLALCDLPADLGVDHPNATSMFPDDVIEHAREMREIIGPSGTGAYTNSQGLSGFRQHVADFIAERDGHPAYPGDIFMTNGASSGIEMIMKGLIAHDTDAIMIPIPQYPIYSALITLLGGRQIGYELDESLNWAVTRETLDQRLQHAKNKGLNVRGLALINPGNPTGQVMDREAVEVICRFCADNDIVMLADEVYQRNVYDPDREFISAKKVAIESPGCENLELISFHSTSKGLIGECGRRGGYLELHNIDDHVHSQIYKLASACLCPGSAGQIMTSLMVNGPKPNGQSYQAFVDEEKAIFDSLARNAKNLVDGLNNIDGIKCVPAQGAMYAFPRLENLPPAAFDAAAEQNISIDTLYALSLLEDTGICVVPASGFGQAEGRVGFRTTFLPPEDVIDKAIGQIATHHAKFCEQYAK